MNLLIQKGYIIWLIVLGMPWAAFGSADCEPCEEPNDPTLVAGGAPPCIPLVEGSAVEGEPCKECDGGGSIRNKEDGTEVEVAGVAGRCCGGVWYKIDQAKEDDECWEWDAYTCSYIELQKNCWKLEEVPPKHEDDPACRDCSSFWSPSFNCPPQRVYKSTYKAIAACSGMSDYREVWAFVQYNYSCEGEMDVDGVLMHAYLCILEPLQNDPCVSVLVTTLAIAVGAPSGASLSVILALAFNDPLALASFLDDLAECAIADMERINTLRSAIRNPGRFIQNSASWLRQFFTSDGWICDYVECKRAFGSKKKYGRTHRLEGDYCP